MPNRTCPAGPENDPCERHKRNPLGFGVNELNSQGFEPRYEVEADPEFPPSGVWPDAVYHFHCKLACSGEDEFRSKWGPPMVLRISPDLAEPWIAMVEAGGLHPFSGLFAAPEGEHLVVVNGGAAYVVDANRPQHQQALGGMSIVGVTSTDSVILLSSFVHLICVDQAGVRWQTERLVLDDLKIVAIDTDSLTVTGSTMEANWVATVRVDMHSGKVKHTDKGPPSS